jgi:hypothetical protein
MIPKQVRHPPPYTRTHSVQEQRPEIYHQTTQLQ